MKKKVNELNMDYTTYKKISGTMTPKDKANITITGDKPKSTTGSPNDTSTSTSTSYSSSMSSMMEDENVEPEAVIEPQDDATIKYLSNVKDATTGEVSKPFTIGDKKYQMVRGITPSKEIVMAVYCHDDMDKAGNNMIHPVEYFEENIAKPFLNKAKTAEVPVKEDNFDYAGEERRFADQEAFMDYLNLSDLEGYKHFFVNVKTGVITAKFKNTKEMIKSGIKLGPNEDYMDAKALKRFRFGDYFKNDVNEEAQVKPEDAGTNIPKLQSDVKKLADMIKNKFSVYLTKLDKPIEQAQFLTAMAAEIGVPLNKLNTIITSYKDIAQDANLDKTTTPGLKAESKVITKDSLIESLKTKKVIKTVKIKDIK